MYDITKRSTFEPLSRWLTDARALASPDLVVVLVGNKTDRGDDEREVGYLRRASGRMRMAFCFWRRAR